MDPLEEQAQEIEVLESIYPKELEKINPTEYVIHIKLETTPAQYVNLRVTYPPEYPEVTPELEIEVGEKWVNANNDEDEYDFDDDEEEEEEEEEEDSSAYPPALLELTLNDMTELKVKADIIAEENMGMPSVFAIASQLKEDAEEVVEQKIRAADKAREVEILKQEAEEQKKFEGTPVTKESFAAWREKFRKDMNVDQLLSKYIIYDKNGQPKLTGRQLFERGLLNDDDDAAEDEDETDAITEGVKKVAVA